MIDYEFLEENEVLLFENPSYETALIGVWEDNNCVYRAVYDRDKMIEYLMESDGMEYDDAVDFMEFNTIRSLPYYPNAPIIVETFAE